MLENANDLKSFTIIKRIDTENEEINITKQYKPKNYTVPMDFNGDHLIFVYKKLKKLVQEPGPDFMLGMFDMNTHQITEIQNFENNIRHLKFFKEGFIYVKDNRLVSYYNLKTNSEQYLYNHQYTIVSLAVSSSAIATIDKGLNINIMNHDNTSFICNELNLMDAKDLPKELESIKLFEMEYPYFSRLSDKYFAVTSDFGVVFINYRSNV